jgi:hypothetical protein
MIELREDALLFSFPEVHPEASCLVDFQRTLRLPDDNRRYPLPAGLGRFPMHHVDDYPDQLPATWRRHGGVFLPMYQSEALWVNFHANFYHSYPCAIKIAAGKINAVSGAPWQNPLVADPQDYVVAPGQRWLDGFAVAAGLIRQFVAMPLGEGYTAEEQLTGAADHGGLQIMVYPMKRERYAAIEAARAKERERWQHLDDSDVRFSLSPARHELGLAPGGLMTQHIAADSYGIDAWEQAAAARCFVHLTNSLTYHAITGHRPPHQPPTAKEYTQAGIPWFKDYAADKQALPGSRILASLDSLATKFFKKTQAVLPGNEPLKPQHVISLVNTAKVREGDF